MAVCEPVSWILLTPVWKALLPGIALFAYPIIGYLAILAALFFLSKLNKMPLIGVFASFVADVLIKLWLSLGIILLVISIFCVL